MPFELRLDSFGFPPNSLETPREGIPLSLDYREKSVPFHSVTPQSWQSIAYKKIVKADADWEPPVRTDSGPIIALALPLLTLTQPGRSRTFLPKEFRNETLEVPRVRSNRRPSDLLRVERIWQHDGRRGF